MRRLRTAKVFELAAPLGMATAILVAVVSQHMTPPPPALTTGPGPERVAVDTVPSAASPAVLSLASISLPPPPEPDGAGLPKQIADISRPKPNALDVDKPIAPTDADETRSTTKVRPPKAPGISAPEITKPTISPIGRVIRPTRRDAQKGQEFLEVMARGEAPGLQIAWPPYRRDRDILRGYLERCAGWRILLSTGESLWSLDEEPGTRWTAPSQISGYMRMVGGTEATVAAELIDRIRQRHGLTGGQTVAVVTRSFDSRLIGGLANLLGEDALTVQKVTGRFAIEGPSVHVTGLRVGDRAVPGAIDLGRMRQCG